MSRFAHTRAKTSRARELRASTTLAERKLWPWLRSAQLGASFRRQHPIGPFFADFCCTSLKLVIELDGSQHALASARDAARTAYMRRLGYVVIRFWNNEVIEELGGVVEQIKWAIKRRKFELTGEL
jgi:very-short-patch-repair endonuclease